MQVALAQYWLRQAGGGSFVKAFLVDIPKSYRCMEHADREQLVALTGSSHRCHHSGHPISGGPGV